jgi:hypothetical protein
VRCGEVSVRKAQTVLPAARGGDEEHWVARARVDTVRVLEKAVRASGIRRCRAAAGGRRRPTTSASGRTAAAMRTRTSPPCARRITCTRCTEGGSACAAGRRTHSSGSSGSLPARRGPRCRSPRTHLPPSRNLTISAHRGSAGS